MDKKTGAIIILSIVAGMLSLFVGLMLVLIVVEKTEKKNPVAVIPQEIDEDFYEVEGFDILTDSEIKKVNKLFRELTADSENVDIYYSKDYQAIICHSDFTFNELVNGQELGLLEDLGRRMHDAAESCADLVEDMYYKEVDRGILITVEGEPFMMALESCGIITFE